MTDLATGTVRFGPFGLRLVAQGHPAVQLDRSAGDDDPRAEHVNRRAGQPNGLAPTQAGVSTDQHEGAIPLWHLGGQAFDLGLGQKPRQFCAFRRQRYIGCSVEQDSPVSHGGGETTTQREYGLAYCSRRKAGIQHVGHPAAHFGVADLDQRGGPEAGQNLTGQSCP
jgi:hypothetical protein